MEENNNIEQTIKHKFDPHQIQNEGWNEPRDIVWDNIEKEIYADERKRFGFLPFMLTNLLLIAIIIIGFLLYQNSNLKTALFEKEIPITASTSIENQTKTSEGEMLTPLEKEEAKNTIIKRKSETNNIVKITTSKIRPNKHLNNNIEVVHNSNFTSSIKSLPALFNESDVLTEGTRSIYVEMQSSNLVSEQVSNKLTHVSRKVEKVTSISKLIHDISYDKKLESKPVLVELQDKKNQRNRSGISVLPQMLINKMSTSGTQDTPLSELINREYGNTGFGLDITMSRPITKSIEITYGLGLESMVFSTEYFLSLPYLSDNEAIEDGHGFIDFEHSLPTAFGNTDTALRLIRVRNTNDPVTENVDIDFYTNHEFLTISAPLGVQKKFGWGASYFKVEFKARPMYIIQANSSIKTVQSHHSEIDAVNNNSFSMYSDVNRFNLGIGINIGYHKHIAGNHGIELMVGFQEYLFNAYAVESYSTSIQKLGISLGYHYTL